MLDYLLKSGGCLLVFYLFYVLFLEKENMHQYKRVYLLATTVSSFAIPFITFTKYVEVVEQIQPMISTEITTEIPIQIEASQQNFFPMILWGIYALGILLFGMKFFKNINDLVIKIKKNPKEKQGSITSVFIDEEIPPHTFFNFIFLNRIKHITKQIPQEVILHEQAHASQKHSLDVVLLELLQVVFWFNPILYLLKRSIKLNHEFLADQAVLNYGTNTKVYQKTLLAYSSNAYQLPMANAINYSSIKKRFTVMNTHTSKKKVWIRSFILLPLFALLLFSFSTTELQEKATPQQVAEYNTLAKKYNKQPKSKSGVVVKLKEVKRLEYLYKLMTPSQKKKAEKFPSFPPLPHSPKVKKEALGKKSNLPPPLPSPLPKDAKYVLDNKEVSFETISIINKDKIQSIDIITKDNNDKKLNKPVCYIYTKKITKVPYGPKTLINGVTCNKCTLKLTKEELAKMVVTVEKGNVTEFKIKFPRQPTVSVSNSNVLNDKARDYLNQASIGQTVQIFNLESSESDLKSHPVLFEITE